MNASGRERVFGGGNPPVVPEGTPMVSLLKLLNEEQLYRLNVRICEHYYKELTDRIYKEGGFAITDVIDDGKRRPRQATTIEST